MVMACLRYFPTVYIRSIHHANFLQRSPGFPQMRHKSPILPSHHDPHRPTGETDNPAPKDLLSRASLSRDLPNLPAISWLWRSSTRPLNRRAKLRPKYSAIWVDRSSKFPNLNLARSAHGKGRRCGYSSARGDRPTVSKIS